MSEWKINSWLCILDIKNEQSEYSHLMDLIHALESLASGYSDYQEFELFRFRITRVPTNVRDSVQTVEDRLADGNSKLVRLIENWEMLISGMVREPSVTGFSYYIRVDIGGESSDLSNFRYLVLLMQSMREASLRLKVFFRADEKEQKESYAFHNRISQFLRFIQIEYRAFYATLNGRVRPLALRTEIPMMFVPLLEINWETCQWLRRPWQLSATYGGESFEKLFMAFRPAVYVQDNRIETLFQTGLRMFFRMLDGKTYATKEKKQKLVSLLYDTFQNAGGISVLDMLLFGALMDRTSYESFGTEKAGGYLHDIQSLSKGVAQIIENIVYHSENRKGVFIIRLQRVQGYIQKNYPGYEITDKEYGVELLIADCNRQDGIIRNFLTSGKATPSLLSLGSKLALSDFFQREPGESTAAAWLEARSNSPEMCHGLLTFAEVAKQFRGAVSVRSGPVPEGTDVKNYYYYNYADEKQLDTAPYRRWMPGTQFAILFRRTAFRRDIQRSSQMDMKSIFHDERIIYGTTYRELAWALRYGSNMTPFFPKDEAPVMLAEQFESKSTCLHMGQQKRKDAVVQEWKRWFSDRAAYVRDSGGHSHVTDSPIRCADEKRKPLRYQILDADLTEFCNKPEEWEMFCKGFLASEFFSRSFYTEWKAKSGEDLCYGILLHNMSESLGETFYRTLINMVEHICTGYVYVYFYQEKESGGAARYIGATLHEVLARIGQSYEKPVHEFPRILPYSLLVRDGGVTLFEKKIAEQAQISILSPDRQGYQVKNTHMRLGNKVHINSFFEMALFFENPNYAYYTAFLLLEHLKNMELEKRNRILFYGYTSYSRGIVWAVIRIWQEYMKAYHGRVPEMEFVIYQNDLKLESDSSSVQMYYSKKEWLQDPRTVWPSRETTLVQIVPISSSLTTFNKMFSKLNSETGWLEQGDPFVQIVNLTAFWVRDDFRQKWKEAKKSGAPDETKPTKEEKNFWKEVDTEKRRVLRNQIYDTSKTPVQYLVSVNSYWHNPLSCRKCFPKNLLLEYPLMETDPTSTVPTQQFYPEVSGAPSGEATEDFSNDERISRLRGNMLYGHISRGHNHFQYYIQTRQYFQQERDSIIKWLSGISGGMEEDERHIDVLVVPKQTSNVEFSQFVYEYRFHGEAESIIVNTEKEFRSNFMAEYNGIRKWLQQESNGSRKVRFHYVDMTIDSGTTFNRAGALVRSLLGQEDGKNGSEAGFPFESVFLLISRMSEDSKRTCVKDPVRQFHTYAQLDISNIRTYGDSCVPCKLQREAYLHYRNAATKPVSEYWEKKSIVRKDVYFDQNAQDCRSQMKYQLTSQDEGYRRMACTHRATSYIRRARGRETVDYFAALRSFFSELLLAVKKTGEEQNQVSPVFAGAEEERLAWLSAGLKIVIRPFFSYDFKLRCAAMDLYLLLVGRLLDPDRSADMARLASEEKGHLNEDNLNWAWSFADELSKILDEDLGQLPKKELALLLGDELDEIGKKDSCEPDLTEEERNICFLRLRFIQSHLLKGLTDLKSNYILRRDTMLLVCKQLAASKVEENLQDAFFSHYLRSILRLMHTSSDEMKSVWLEHLLQFQEEYDPQVDIKQGGNMEQQIEGNWPEVHPAFCRFFGALLVENNRPLFQGIQDLAGTFVGGEEDATGVKNMLREYYMRSFCQFINLGAGKGMSIDGESAESELSLLWDLYTLLNLGDKKANGSNDPLAWYDDLRCALEKIVPRKNGKQSDTQTLLFGRHVRGRELPRYYMISPRLAVDYTGQSESDAALNRLAERLNEGEEKKLEKNGYLLLLCPWNGETETSGRQEPLYDVILHLDNNFESINRMHYKGYNIQKIEPVYIFLSCGVPHKQALMVVRRILMFRCALIACLERDFNNNTIANLIRQRYWSETLAADKVGDHNELGFMECMQQVITDEGNWDGKDCDVIGADGKVESEALRRPKYNWNGTDIDVAASGGATQLERTRRWYFLCSYVNSRISRLYRTYARETNHREYTGDHEDSIEQSKILYSQDNQDLSMKPAHNLSDVFFVQIGAGYSRKEFILQMMQVLTFRIKTEENGETVIRKDTEKGESMKERLSFMQEMLRDYDCIRFDVKEGKYAYLSEYLAVIFLDCCISALKAGKDWNSTRWGDLAFNELYRKQAADKCQIFLSRQQGPDLNDPSLAFDYLVIENYVDVERSKDTRQGPGMSQKAIRWYIDKLWKIVMEDGENRPQTVFKSVFEEPSNPKEIYQIKLPILKRKKES